MRRAPITIVSERPRSNRTPLEYLQSLSVGRAAGLNVFSNGWNVFYSFRAVKESLREIYAGKALPDFRLCRLCGLTRSISEHIEACSGRLASSWLCGTRLFWFRHRDADFPETFFGWHVGVRAVGPCDWRLPGVVRAVMKREPCDASALQRALRKRMRVNSIFRANLLALSFSLLVVPVLILRYSSYPTSSFP